MFIVNILGNALTLRISMLVARITGDSRSNMVGM